MSVRPAPGYLIAPEVCKQAGCTARQLNYWVRTGVVVPAVQASGSGQSHGFTAAQVDAVRAVALLARYRGTATHPEVPRGPR